MPINLILFVIEHITVVAVMGVVVMGVTVMMGAVMEALMMTITMTRMKTGQRRLSMSSHYIQVTLFLKNFSGYYLHALVRELTV